MHIHLTLWQQTVATELPFPLLSAQPRASTGFLGRESLREEKALPLVRWWVYSWPQRQWYLGGPAAVNGRHAVAPPDHPVGTASLGWAVWLYEHHFSQLDPWEVRKKDSLHVEGFQLIIKILEPNTLKIDRIYWGDWREKANAHWSLIWAMPYWCHVPRPSFLNWPILWTAVTLHLTYMPAGASEWRVHPGFTTYIMLLINPQYLWLPVSSINWLFWRRPSLRPVFFVGQH